jgi:formylglycine-generating enzyme required for sulfatase activity
MLLTTMAIIHQREIGLPRERVRLYSLAVQVLLSRWQRWKGIAVSDELESILRDDLRMRAILERLAYEAHCCQAEQGESADLVRRDLWALLEDPALLGDVGLADEFLDYVDQRAGLLVGQGGGDGGRHPQTYAFPHRTFQEYLAGAYMVGRRGTTREYWRRASEGDTWYLAALLGAEELLYNRRSAKELLDLAYDLCPQTPPGDESAWRAALWSGQMATLLGDETIRRDTERPDGGAAYLERLVPRQVIILRKTALGAVERADAGNVLARLGDPRFREDAWHLPNEPLLGFVKVPEGPFLMGSDKEQDPRAYDDELPQHEMRLRAYYIARYPVTQAQYAEFVRDTGHDVPSSKYGFEEDRPFEWRDGSYPPGRANQPVVLVSWHDALAYCEWLTEKLRVWDETPEPLATLLREEGWRITLPSEAEWEKAARGLGRRIFPWGNEANPERANYSDTGIGTTSAVGCFPDGASPYGVEDLSGNVWEWCRTKWEENYRDYQGDDDLEGDAPRVLRGGSFFYDDWYVRCASRSVRSSPDPRLRNYGFRVVASPVRSDL